MFEAVIFDFDGVILNSEPIHYEACYKALETFGLTLSNEEYSDLYLGISDVEKFPKLLRSKGIEFSQEEIDQLIEQKIKHYTHVLHQREKLPIIVGVIQYIHEVFQKVGSIAICSGSSRREVMTALTKLKQDGELLLDFNTIVTSEDVEEGKPSPEGYLLTAKRLGVSPDKCLVIEDSPHGVEAAKKAGMYVVAILTTHDRHKLKKADAIIDNFTHFGLRKFMNKEQIFDIIKKNTLYVIPALSIKEITLGQQLKELGANSMDRMDIIIASMEDVGVKIPLLELARTNNINELVELFMQHCQHE